MQAHSRWNNAIRKGVISDKKRGVKHENTQLFCKYAIEYNPVA